MKYWLFKSEEDVFSIHHLAKQKNQTSTWEGIRNYQARNFLRDEVKLKDKVLFYHSSSDPTAAVGTCSIIKEGYLDHFAFEPKSDYFDPKSKIEKPQWYMVDIQLETIFKNPVTLKTMRETSELSEMRLLQKGNRLSVFPILKSEYDLICKLGNQK